MPQRDLLLPWLSAIDNAALALRNRGVAQGARRARRAAELFERFGLDGFERRAAGASSRAGCASGSPSCARSLSGKPVLALDEPFASLDAITRAEMQSWLAAALGRGPATVVLVTHDVEEALYLCDRVARPLAAPGADRRRAARRRRRGPRDRDAAVTDPAFVAARERAMRALRDERPRAG